MWDFNWEDDATHHGRKGPDSAAALIKTLSALYKGEEEEFLHVNPQGGFLCTIPKLGKWTLLLAHPFYIPIVKYSV